MIDKRAQIDTTVKLGKNVKVGPWAIIEGDVTIGDHSIIGPHAFIKGNTRIGQHNHIFQFASVGEDPQDKKYHGEKTYLEMGDHNVVREFCTINRGTEQGGGITKIGNDNLFMAYVHVAHDCIIANHTILANYVGLAGHVTIEDYAILSGYSAVHQFCTIGAHSFVGKLSMVTKDVLPYLLISGVDPVPYGINAEGLKRRGFSPETLEILKQAYKIIFRSDFTVNQSLKELEPLLALAPEVEPLITSLKNSQRGIVR